MNSDVLGIAAGGWGVAMSLAPIFQIRAIRRAGQSDGVSAAQWSVWIVGFSLWLAYGISIRDWPLIINNIVAVTMGTTTLAVILLYRSTRRSGKGGVPVVGRHTRVGALG